MWKNIKYQLSNRFVLIYYIMQNKFRKRKIHDQANCVSQEIRSWIGRRLDNIFKFFQKCNWYKYKLLLARKAFECHLCKRSQQHLPILISCRKDGRIWCDSSHSSVFKVMPILFFSLVIKFSKLGGASPSKIRGF